MNLREVRKGVCPFGRSLGIDSCRPDLCAICTSSKVDPRNPDEVVGAHCLQAEFSASHPFDTHINFGAPGVVARVNTGVVSRRA